jgi:GNAT superfamily N-acetyltransferase
MIRRAAFSDLPSIMPLLHLMHAEAPEYCGIPFDPEKTEKSVRSWIDAFGHLALVAGDGITRPLAGMLFASVGEYFFSSEKYSCDRFLYVHPDKRGGTIGMSLIRKYEAWATRHGIKDRNICLGLSTGVNMERNGMLLEKLGYVPYARCYAKRGSS